MEIIDAQIHKPEPWLEYSEQADDADARLATEISLAYMDAAGVDRAVMSANRVELAWARFAASSFPERLAITPSNALDPAAPDLAEQMQELKGTPGVLAYRQSIVFPPEAVETFKAGGFDAVFAACDKLGLPLMLLVTGQAALISGIAERYPNLPLIVDHLGLPQPPLFQKADDPPFKNLTQVVDLAKYDNVSVKFSGAPTLSAEQYPFADLWPHLNRLVEAFGPGRLMWGTDIMRVTGRMAGHSFEVDYQGLHSYGEAVGFLRDTDQLSESEKEQIFGGSLRRILGWPT